MILEAQLLGIANQVHWLLLLKTTDADVVIDGGFTDSNVSPFGAPFTLSTKKEKIGNALAKLKLGEKHLETSEVENQDFSEDTYRTLTAVDSCLMVIDAAKGVEDRTRKLMEVTRLRDTPIITFINKLDREGMEPLDIFEDIENKYSRLFPNNSNTRMLYFLLFSFFG
mgnify:CR=1 FL=1